MRLSFIEAFEHNNKHYTHSIDLDNDSVYLFDDDSNPLLEYTSNAAIYQVGETPIRLGRFNIVDNHWVFTDEITEEKIKGNSFSEVEGLLHFEIKISKRWLSAQPVTTS